MQVLFDAPGKQAPRGKLAEVTLQFTESEGPLLDGLELQGLEVWERRDGSGVFLTLPGRQYTDRDNKKKTYDYLRATGGREHFAKIENLKALILEQYQEWAGR
jgi:hypothetical protein